jgi:type IV secretory pathway component VirB8
MLSNGIIAFMLACGIGGWTYSKSVRRSGGQAKTDVTVAAIVGVITFLIALTILAMLPIGK